ncbi:hypothetical protein L1987_78239 [Smallanthus sonchifolius]|uniref:Uncharacterized protein n=1 Tax=Smallanthus sonchifolius TaxID=185202 RepID=A0ACB8ZCC3_9ASTR|nr:hypothetical protein L1987_78239 [Smallanthus sonchifolius]
MQDIGITPSMAKELKKLEEMISSVPGVVQPIPEISSSSHRISRFAPLICDAKIPKRFQTPNIKLRKFERITSDLYRITQNPRKSLRDYVSKFGRESLDIPNLDVATAVQAFKMGLKKDSQFYEDLVMNPCRNLDEVKNRALRVNAVEDDEEEEEYPKLSEYCFSVDTNGLLYAIRDLGDKARWPRKFERNNGWKDKSKWCAFHEDFGHAKEKTRLWIMTGSRKEQNPRRQMPSKKNAKEAKTEKGDRPIRTSSWTEEKVISFDEDDIDNVQDAHHDGLVITLYIANHFIRRILIDGGSSMNIIQHDVLNRLGIPDFKIISKCAVQDPDVKVLVGTNIPKDIEQNLIELLKSRTSTFAWKHEDMTGISKDIIMHKLGVDNSFRPIHKKSKKFAPERNAIIQEEVERLLKAGMIREVKFPRWLANVVVVQKKNGKWRVCVDFTDLNKACPKDPFPLPHIDSMVDATTGHEMQTFMDASSGFQQIQMEPSDQEDTAFMTPTCIYCYIAMPFGLKNAGATYQRLVNMMFKEKLGDNMEVYIDDMAVKSKKAEDHLRDLRDAFDILDQYNMKLNPFKCHFGVGAGKFLGYMVTKRGTEAILEKIKAIINLKSPANTKDVEGLTGRVAALNRFISRSLERCKEFYDILKKNNRFEWEGKHEQALQSLKE